ncbi:hypothetical protein [Paracidovorax wautersii]|uniref:Uncharacterized protein n=1 Tax=Paracidovorax wautersii TaxID=1177982 RepID=A0ABU1IG29_9BURK|nr:hypothetical protein [Paracidovorax wautersii]MDR6216187.1 hypothetical protein [Paracidovorax wautersii]
MGGKMLAAIKVIVSASEGGETGQFPSNASTTRALDELEQSQAYAVIGANPQMKADWTAAREKLTNQADHSESDVVTAARTILALLEQALIIQGIGQGPSGGGGGTKKSPHKLREMEFATHTATVGER